MLLKKVKVVGVALWVIAGLLLTSGIALAQQQPIDRTGDYYAVICPFLSLDYYGEYKRAIKLLEEELPGVTVELLGPADYDEEATFMYIDQAIARGADGILTMPWSETWTPYVDKAVDAGIPVILIGVEIPGSKRLCYIGTANYVMGQRAAEWIAERIGYKGKVAVMRSPALANVTERYEGFKDTMEKYPDIEIIADLDHQMDSAIGAQEIVGVVQRCPDLAAIYGADGIGGPACAMGIREAGVPKGSILVLGSDREDALLALIEEGEIAGTEIQGSTLEVYLGVKILDMLKHFNVQLGYDDKAAGITLAPYRINPDVAFITQDNVKYFRRGYYEE